VLCVIFLQEEITFENKTFYFFLLSIFWNWWQNMPTHKYSNTWTMVTKYRHAIPPHSSKPCKTLISAIRCRSLKSTHIQIQVCYTGYITVNNLELRKERKVKSERLLPSGIWRRVVWYKFTDVPGKLAVSMCKLLWRYSQCVPSKRR